MAAKTPTHHINRGLLGVVIGFAGLAVVLLSGLVYWLTISSLATKQRAITEANQEVPQIRRIIGEYYSANGSYPSREGYRTLLSNNKELRTNSVTEFEYMYSIVPCGYKIDLVTSVMGEGYKTIKSWGSSGQCAPQIDSL